MVGPEWLVALLSGEKSLHLKFLNFRNKNTKTSSTTQTQITNNFNGPVNIITVNGRIDASTKSQLQPLLDTFDDKQVLFLADEPKRILSDIMAHEQSDEVRGLLKFFKSKLNTRDYQLMRTGLYIKFLRESDRQNESTKVWKQFSLNSTAREKRIVNLASAGYYHTFFRPLYKQLNRGQNGEARFKKEYESILDDLTFAIFVHTNMSTEQIVQRVIDRAIKNIKYGVKTDTISVHATGPQLVARVKSAVQLLKTIFPTIKMVSTPRGTEIIKVLIEYRNHNLPEEEFNTD